MGKKRFTQTGFLQIIVVDERDTYRGTIDRNIVERAIIHGFSEDTLHSFINQHEKTVSPHTNIETISKIIFQRHQRLIPVLNEDRKILGVITRSDLLRAFV